MSVRDQSTEPLDPLFREALRWIALVASPEATESDARMAVAWRAQSAAHDAAFQEAAAFRRFVRATDPPGRTAEVVAFPSRAPPPGLSRRAAMFGGGAMAAGVAGLMAARPPLGLWPSLAEFMADRHTGAGQRRSFAMTGGAAVELNGRTAVSIVDHGHGLKLVEGEAFVAAARGTTPVLVRAGDAALTLASGSLNVRTSARETCATCLSGAAVAEHPGGRVTLAAGEALTLGSGGVVRVAKVDPTIAASWRHGLLIFQDTPLAEAVEAINRYSDGRIVLANKALARRPVDGVYHTNALRGVADQLQSLLRVQVTRLPGNVAVLS